MASGAFGRPGKSCANRDPWLPYSDSKCLCRSRSAPILSPATADPLFGVTSRLPTAPTRPMDGSCDAGMKARKRYCTNPSPAYGGKPCIGRGRGAPILQQPPPIEEQSNIPWSEWSN
ncbi:Semaphorin5Blike, partial [Caligus rogercresseyi]